MVGVLVGALPGLAGRRGDADRRHHRRRSGDGGRDLGLAGDADAQVVLLDLNLGQLRLVEKGREFADEVLIDRVFF